MLILLLLMALLFVYLSPSIRIRVLSAVYFIFLAIVLSGIEGFIFAGDPTQNEQYAFWALYLFVLIIHIPLVIKLLQLDFKRRHIRSARDIFGEDLKHLSDHQLHKHLE